MTTTFAPSTYLFAYLPRTPLLKSYSSSMSGSFCILFILLPFFFGCLSCANQPDVVAPFRVNNYQKTVFVRVSDQDEPLFFLGMQRIINGQSTGGSTSRACS